MARDNEPSARAWAIATGLIRTHRAINATVVSGFICLVAGYGQRYWVSSDGRRVLRGQDLDTADELQPGFVSTMARAGGYHPRDEA